MFIYWGWDVVLTMSEETEGAHSTPERAATLTIIVIVVLYQLISIATLSHSGVGEGQYGLGNPAIQANIFGELASPIMGTTRLSHVPGGVGLLRSIPAIHVYQPSTNHAGHGMLRSAAEKFSQVSPKFQSPGYATVVSAVVAFVFYAVIRVVSEAVLWDVITALGMMVCFYYGATVFACVWYFQRTAFTSARNAISRFMCAFIGGAILIIFFLRRHAPPITGSGLFLALRRGAGKVLRLSET